MSNLAVGIISLLLAAIITLIYFLVKEKVRGRDLAAAGRMAEDILRELALPAANWPDPFQIRRRIDAFSKGELSQFADMMLGRWSSGVAVWVQTKFDRLMADCVNNPDFDEFLMMKVEVEEFILSLYGGVPEPTCARLRQMFQNAIGRRYVEEIVDLLDAMERDHDRRSPAYGKMFDEADAMFSCLVTEAPAKIPPVLTERLMAARPPGRRTFVAMATA